MYLQEYHRQIKSGRIVANKKIIKIYDRLMSEINNPHLPYTFDESKASRPIEFIEKFCKQSIGIAGAPLKLELFQKAFIEALFGFTYKDTGHRRFQESLFLVARKNGKTTFLAAIALYMLIADKEASAECYSVATKQDQVAHIILYAIHPTFVLNVIIAEPQQDGQATPMFRGNYGMN